MVRDLIESHPHQISVRSPQARTLAAALVDDASVLKMTFGSDGRSLVIETPNRDAVFGRLQSVIVAKGLEVEEIISPDDNLQAVFDYLVGK